MKLIYKLLIYFTILANSGFACAEERIALIIGNSKYIELGVLNNTINDAKIIENSLKKIGYKTTIILDGNEVSIRKGLKKFAADSEQASVSVVYYAGHGAQINGENYLLPIDLEAPKRESDIQLSALKIDDIINSIKSKVKVLFLDACRDNPVLTKTLAKGRGSYRGGISPTVNNYNDGISIGIFIAYATDAGNIALDGEGQENSPFAESLAKYIAEPISIDDMFSKVTKEVKNKTNNSQKPYKYASLEDIFCLTIKCGVIGNLSTLDIPAMSNQTNEWVLFNFGGKKLEQAWLIKPSSIELDGERAFADIKILNVEDGDDKKVNSYNLNSMVINCKNAMGNVYKSKAVDENNQILFDQVFGFPKTVELTFDYSDKGTLGYSIFELICKKSKHKPIVDSKINQNSEWDRFYTLNDGDEIYIKRNSTNRVGDIVEIKAGLIFKNPILLSKSTIYPGYEKLKKAPIIEFSASIQKIDCKEKTYWSYTDQLYNTNSELVAYTLFQEHLAIKNKIETGSAFEQLYKSICNL